MKRQLTDNTIDINQSTDEQQCEAVDIITLPITTGVCQFCGQVQNVSGCITQGEADELVTTRCTCDDGEEYRAGVRRAKLRDRDIAKAGETIDNLFKGLGRDHIICLLKTAAEMVYDNNMESITVGVTYTTRAKIARSGKGLLTIERKDTTSAKTEI